MCRLRARLSLFIYVACISPGTEATLLYILDTHQFGNSKIISLETESNSVILIFVLFR